MAIFYQPPFFQYNVYPTQFILVVKCSMGDGFGEGRGFEWFYEVGLRYLSIYLNIVSPVPLGPLSITSLFSIPSFYIECYEVS